MPGGMINRREKSLQATFRLAEKEQPSPSLDARWHDLPADLHQPIYAALPLADQVRWRAVSRAFNQLSMTTPARLPPPAIMWPEQPMDSSHLSIPFGEVTTVAQANLQFRRVCSAPDLGGAIWRQLMHCPAALQRFSDRLQHRARLEQFSAALDPMKTWPWFTSPWYAGYLADLPMELQPVAVGTRPWLRIANAAVDLCELYLQQCACGISGVGPDPWARVRKLQAVAAAVLDLHLPELRPWFVAAVGRAESQAKDAAPPGTALAS